MLEQGNRQTYSGSINNFVACDRLSLLVHLESEIVLGRSSIGNIIFDSKVSVGTTRSVTGRQQNSTSGLIFTDHVRCGRSGKNGILSDYELSNAICRANFENRLYSFWRKITTISTNYEGGAFGCNRVEDGLNKVFCIMLMAKSIHLQHV